MKKIFTILVLFISFSFSAIAQENKNIDSEYEAIYAAAKNDIKVLSTLVKLEESKINNYFQLFMSKHKELSHDLSQERLNILELNNQTKIMQDLNIKQREILKQNPEILKKLSLK